MPDEAPTSPDLTVVIVSWNTRDLLAQCLRSCETALAGVACGRCQVWVIDNASSDETASMVRAAFPGVYLVANTDNRGFASANNQALRECTSRYILLLNPDTEVHPGAFAGLLAFMDAHPEAGAAGPRLLNPDGSLQASSYRFPTLTREAWRLFHLDRFWHCSDYAMPAWPIDRPQRVDVVQGAALLLRRDALLQVGLLDETYFMYTEEVDLCRRLVRAGWSIYWVPEAAVVHYGGQSTRLAASDMFVRLYESKILYFRKHHGSFQTRLYKLVLFAASLPRLAGGLLARPDQDELRQLAQQYRRLVAVLPGL
jgi:GT2 family glycosyltransferase